MPVSFQHRKCRWLLPLFSSVVAVGLLCAACTPKQAEETTRRKPVEATAPEEKDSNRSSEVSSPARATTVEDAETTRYRTLRHRMVEQQIAARGISDARVLDVMRRVPRHLFVCDEERRFAYADSPLPIGHGQTISQPLIVALMTEMIQPKADARALDVGTGSGYQAAVLAELVKEVYSIEIVCPLADEARDRLRSLGYKNVNVRCGDGYQGWQEHAPFDVIIVAAAPDHVPQPLIEQLAAGGRMVIPVGRRFQKLTLIEKRPDGTVKQTTADLVRFVPMTGEARNR